MCLTIDKIDLIKVSQSQIVDLEVGRGEGGAGDQKWELNKSTVAPPVLYSVHPAYSLERGVSKPSFNRTEDKRKSKGQRSFARHAQ